MGRECTHTNIHIFYMYTYILYVYAQKCRSLQVTCCISENSEVLLGKITVSLGYFSYSWSEKRTRYKNILVEVLHL